MLKAAVGSLALKIAAAGMGLVNGVLLARLLGPAEFGVYSIAMAAVTLLGTLAALGLPPLVTREVAVSHAQENWPFLKGILAISQRRVLLASSLLVLGIGVFVLLGWVPAALTLTGWLAALALIPLAALNLLRGAILRGLHWIITADLPDLMVRPSAMLIMLGAMYGFATKLDAGAALLLQAGAALLALGVGSWLLTQRLPWGVRVARAETALFRWNHSSRVFLGITVLGLLEGQVPLYLLGQLAGAEQAGLYQAANQIVSVVVMGLVSINMPLQPKLAAAWANGSTQEVQQLVTQATRLAAAVALAGFLILLFSAEWVLRIYGTSYIEAADALRILAFGQLVNAVSGPCGLVLAATGKQKLALYGVGAGLGVAAAVVLVLVPLYGLVGAAVGGMSGLLVWNALLAYWAWRFVRIRTLLS